MPKSRASIGHGDKAERDIHYVQRCTIQCSTQVRDGFLADLLTHEVEPQDQNHTRRWSEPKKGSLLQIETPYSYNE